MNRDWFARTQPETDGKIELMRRYPPVLFIDAHEMPRDRGFFFPPNADPVYHESGETQIGWINGIYGPALAGEFRSRGIPFFSRRQFDLFYAGYGDTVPILGFGAAGMTFEKGGTEAAAVRVLHQHLAQWVTVSAAAAQRRSLNEALHASFLQAYQQGVAGTLERNCSTIRVRASAAKCRPASCATISCAPTSPARGGNGRCWSGDCNGWT